MILIQKLKRSESDICEYLTRNETQLTLLISTSNITEYAIKIHKHAHQFWAINLADNEYIGFMACYFNDKVNNIGFITTLSVATKYQGKKIGCNLLQQAVKYAQEHHFKKIKLEVNRLNDKAKLFYERNGFNVNEESEKSFFMETNIYQKIQY